MRESIILTISLHKCFYAYNTVHTFSSYHPHLMRNLSPIKDRQAIHHRDKVKQDKLSFLFVQLDQCIFGPMLFKIVLNI